MIKGITQNEQKIIKEILKQYPYDFYYYGSRVKGDFTKSSDLDILLKTNQNVSISILKEISDKFNQSKIPYIINISDYNKMSEDFIRLIEPTLIKA